MRLILFVLMLAALLLAPAGVTVAQTNAVEIEFWQSVKESTDASEIEAYLQSYPKGKFAPLARIRLKKLKDTLPYSETAKNTKKPETPSTTADIYKAMDLFGDVLERVRMDYVEERDDGKMIEAAINGIMSWLDPHSSYINARKFRDMQVQTRGEFGGLGFEVTMESGVVKVITPIDDTPSARAGLQPGDLITHIDSEQLRGLTLQQAVEKMRGPVNTPVVLTIVRKPGVEPFDVKLVRQIIRIGSVKVRIEKDVGYIRIAKFIEQTSKSLAKAVAQIKNETGGKLKGYVIDLRNNPGGLLDQSVTVTDAFLDRGTIVITRGRDRSNAQRYVAKQGDVTDGKRLIVLINGGSAGVSEIVAGALQDHRRATIVGTRSFGYGSVQTIIPLGESGVIRLTTSRYFTPSGRSIQAKGVDPDIVVEQELPDEWKKRDRQPGGETSLRSHLRGEGGKERSGSSNYVPRDKNKDAQLQFALKLVRE